MTSRVAPFYVDRRHACSGSLIGEHAWLASDRRELDSLGHRGRPQLRLRLAPLFCCVVLTVALSSVKLDAAACSQAPVTAASRLTGGATTPDISAPKGATATLPRTAQTLEVAASDLSSTPTASQTSSSSPTLTEKGSRERSIANPEIGTTTRRGVVSSASVPNMRGNSRSILEQVPACGG